MATDLNERPVKKHKVGEKKPSLAVPKLQDDSSKPKGLKRRNANLREFMAITMSTSKLTKQLGGTLQNRPEEVKENLLTTSNKEPVSLPKTPEKYEDEEETAPTPPEESLPVMP